LVATKGRRLGAWQGGRMARHFSIRRGATHIVFGAGSAGEVPRSRSPPTRLSRRERGIGPEGRASSIGLPRGDTHPESLATASEIPLESVERIRLLAESVTEYAIFMLDRAGIASLASRRSRAT
jgi:hypothetical protein